MAYDPTLCPDDFGCDNTLDVWQKFNAAFYITEDGCIALRTSTGGGGGGGGDASAANQVTGNSSLASLVAKDFATQTTLTAVLAKIIAAPSTEAKQDTGNTSLASLVAKDYATQTTLAAFLSANHTDLLAILTKLTVNPSTSTLQTTGNTSLSSIDGKTPALGQALAAASIPVVLTALQLAALTPLTHVSVDAGSNVIGKVSIDQTTPGTTNLVQTKQMPDATATFSTTPYISTALEASCVAKASAGNIYGFVYSNSAVFAQYVQVHNSATLPANGAVPALSFLVAAGGTFPFDTGKFGNFFSAGIALCNSTTQFTKTIGAADSLFYVQKA